MKTMVTTTRLSAMVLVLALGSLSSLWLITRRADALPAYSRLFEQQYGYRSSCASCHVRGGGSQNTDFGRDFLKAGGNLKAFERLQQKDSDDDGILNLDEIQARANPGDRRSTPNNPGEWLANVEKEALPLKELRDLFPGSERFSSVEGLLSEDKVRDVEAVLGSSLLDEDRVPTFYFPVKEVDGKLKRVGVASFATQHAPKGEMMLAIAVNTKAAVTNVRILKHKEIPKLADKDFLAQFIGKTSKDPLKVGQDIRPIPGEEAASQAVATAVRKYLLVTRAAFAKKKG